MSVPKPMLCVAAAAAVAWMAGCNSPPRTVDSTGGRYRETTVPPELVAMARPPLPDLPVPIGFKLDEGRSRNFRAAGARYVDHVYKGGADRFAVARFYKRHMPVSRWVLVTDRFVQGDMMLDFEKETQRCMIIVSKGGLFNPTHIKVQIWTTGRIVPDNAKASAGK